MKTNKILNIKKKKHLKIYQKIKKIFQTKSKEADKFNYACSTNNNESFHHSLLTETPKGINFKFYNERISLSVLKHNQQEFFYPLLFKNLKIPINYFTFNKLINVERKRINTNIKNNTLLIKNRNKKNLIKKKKIINLIKKKEKNEKEYPNKTEKIKFNNEIVETQIPLNEKLESEKNNIFEKIDCKKRKIDENNLDLKTFKKRKINVCEINDSKTINKKLNIPLIEKLNNKKRKSDNSNDKKNTKKRKIETKKKIYLNNENKTKKNKKVSIIKKKK
jgi:hypothetical protein